MQLLLEKFMQAAMNQEKSRILFVDDELAILKSMRRLSRANGWDVTLANSGQEALEILEKQEFDVIVSDMRMPHMSGAELLEQTHALYPNMVRIILSGYSDKLAIQHAINEAHIFKFLTKPWIDDELVAVVGEAIQFREDELRQAELAVKTEERSKTLGKVAILLDKKAKERDIEVEQAMSIIKTMNSQAQSRLLESLNVLNQIVEWREGRDAGHSRFVALYSEKIGRALGMSDGEIEDLLIAATLHRIGMVCLPDTLSKRPYYDLSNDERKIYESYPSWGAKALKQAASLKNVAHIIRHHREYVNGKGIPDQLTDQDIPLASKIICLVGDYFDAFNGRLEKNITGTKQATEYIQSWMGKRYDTNIAKLFFSALEHIEDNCWQVKTVRSPDLAAGMIIDADVVAKTGVLLLKKGAKLCDDSIKHIQEFERQNREQYSIRVAIDNCKHEESVDEHQEKSQ